jgi:hypothetical protein
MSRRVLQIGALCTILLAGGLVRSVRAAEPAPLITLELAKVPLSQVIQLLASNGGVEIIINDPEGKLADRSIPYISIKQRTIEKALELVCKTAEAHYQRDKDGIYIISAKPFVNGDPLAMPLVPMAPAPAPVEMEPPAEVLTEKVSLEFMDPNDLVRFLTSSHTKKGENSPKSLDDIMPGLVDPATNQWYLPQGGYPSTAPMSPIFTQGGKAPTGGLSQGNQLGGFGGGGLGGGGFGGGGLGGGGLGGGGLGGSGLGGGGLGGGQGQGAGLNLLPQGINGLVGYPLDNSLLVQGTADSIEQLKRIIRLLDIPPRQISIKIEQIAVQATFEKSFGLDFQLTHNDIDVRSNIGLSTEGAILVSILGDNWRANFAAAVASGKASTINAFQITTMNNVMAMITQITQTTIFIPTINQVQGAGLQTVFVPFPLQATTSFFAIPRVNGDGSITMIIPITFQRFLGESVGPNGERIPNLTSTTLMALRRVGSGQTIVVGGITDSTDTTNSSGIPILKDLPFVGSLFRSRRQVKNNNESLFFFTPTLLPDPVATGGSAVQ